MDSVIHQHLEWVKSIEYRYVEREPEELDGFFEVIGTVTGAAVGMTVGGALGSGVLAAVLMKIGRAVDKKAGV